MRSGLFVAGVAGLLAFAGSAQATFFSTASDTNSSGFTFMGSAGSGPSNSFTIMQDATANFLLRVDDDNGPRPYIEIPVRLEAALTATPLNSVNIGGTTFRHSYGVSGNFRFVDRTTGQLLLGVALGATSPALLTIIGTRTTWSSTGGFLGADSFTDVTYTVTDEYINRIGGVAVAAGYGLSIPSGQTQANSVGPDDFSWTLTVINSGTPGANVSLNSAFAPTSGWKSEGSYSGSSVIPTPGATALLGAAGLLAVRRRRR